MNYKQSVYAIQLRTVKNNFNYEISSLNGEREENNKCIKVNNCKTLFEDFEELELSISEKQLIDIKKIIKSTKDYLEKKSVELSFLIHLHNEKVLFDDDKMDKRSYGFLRIQFMDLDCNIHVDDIPILSYKQENIENGIRHYIESYISKKIIHENDKKSNIEFRNMPHILSPRAAGYFMHEIIGHTFEEDNYIFFKNLYENINISKKLTVIDSVNGYEKIIGLHKYDDLGNELRPLTFIKNGKIQNILAINTKNSLDKSVYGFARRESYKFTTLPRMRGTYVKEFDKMSQQDIFNQYQEAIFVDQILSGEVYQQTGNYKLYGNGFFLKNGEPIYYIGKLIITGNIIKDINCIEYVGKDLKFFGGYCSKLGQTIRVGIGSPTIGIYELNSRGNLYGRR